MVIALFTSPCCVRRSGTGIHTDPLGTSAWNMLLQVPPDQREGCLVSTSMSRGSGFCHLFGAAGAAAPKRWQIEQRQRLRHLFGAAGAPFSWPGPPTERERGPNDRTPGAKQRCAIAAIAAIAAATVAVTIRSCAAGQLQAAAVAAVTIRSCEGGQLQL